MSRYFVLTGIGALAIAGGTAAWITLCTRAAQPASPAQAVQTPPAPTQTQTQIQPAPAPAQTQASPLPASRRPASTATAPIAAAASTPAPGVAGQQAFIDPKTGQLRPPEHDDVATLTGQTSGLRRLARTAQAEPQEFATEGGAMGVVVPDELQPYTVATKTPDGGLVIEHVTGGRAAAAKVRANTAKKGAIERKGEPNDR
jgi:hypothetical protein